MTIARHILNSSSLGSKTALIGDLEDFFCDFEDLDEKAWPLNINENGYKTGYHKTKVGFDKFGFGKMLSLEVVYSKPSQSYLVSEDIVLDDNKLEIYLLSFYRKEKKIHDCFVADFIEKHYQFLKKWVKKTGIFPENALMKIEAHSGSVDGMTTRGGYVWATYGFDFLDEHELGRARSDFKEFAAKKGVLIDPKDLAYFKYPCHFAAFECVNENGQKKDLGKEFLLQYSWQGKISAEMSQRSELYRYGKACHNENKEVAKKELSKSFRRMMKRYQKPSKTKKNFLSILKSKKQRC